MQEIKKLKNIIYLNKLKIYIKNSLIFKKYLDLLSKKYLSQIIQIKNNKKKQWGSFSNKILENKYQTFISSTWKNKYSFIYKDNIYIISFDKLVRDKIPVPIKYITNNYVLKYYYYKKLLEEIQEAIDSYNFYNYLEELSDIHEVWENLQMVGLEPTQIKSTRF